MNVALDREHTADIALQTHGTVLTNTLGVEKLICDHCGDLIVDRTMEAKGQGGAPFHVCCFVNLNLVDHICLLYYIIYMIGIITINDLINNE